MVLWSSSSKYAHTRIFRIEWARARPRNGIERITVPTSQFSWRTRVKNRSCSARVPAEAATRLDENEASTTLTRLFRRSPARAGRLLAGRLRSLCQSPRSACAGAPAGGSTCRLLKWPATSTTPLDVVFVVTQAWRPRLRGVAMGAFLRQGAVRVLKINGFLKTATSWHPSNDRCGHGGETPRDGAAPAHLTAAGRPPRSMFAARM